MTTPGGRLDVPEFEALYRATAPHLFGYLRRRGVAEAEDVVAEVFAVAWRRRAELPDADLRRAWLFGAARRVVLQQSRREQRAGRAAEAAAMLASSTTGASATRSSPVRENAVARALARLDPAAREIVRLAEWEGLSPAEIAVVIGVRPGTARVRLHRARRALAADPELRGVLQDGDHTTRLEASTLPR
ncbi:RNA polymerase sigma factor [Nocardioides acrostichi]|uniref:Sigma-70 family RNA polymerase sigma factor n=1 Tax=Nocardioides acrostichi TaxID=2784339 RepID=A0A930Y5S5_9ACTN|nr:sigma-70 family RNA polymerase sigma factor [Nocardioides acrostichi]MBF4160192.1 sigma-70 family RNA polymerase sigma factor [Nocardioides acrostichi]